MNYEQDMRSFKGRSLKEQAKVLGIHPLIFMLIPLFVMIPFVIVKTAIVVIAIVAIGVSIKGLTFQECGRFIKRQFKRNRVVYSVCPRGFQRYQGDI
ncbi:hypothetical protein [Cysteiniphilum marinum]|uniref:hypothetical protein n=1 Tax=Cysteiniphilum marinum TaxID=2774191 RepID=UPI00193AC917|nr:hypothetical protein [Cysteiniphilum marinum]